MSAQDTQTAVELNSSSMTHYGKVGSYPGNGFTQILAEDKRKSQLMLAELKQNLWLGPGTRVLFIDFTVYNPNLNMWCVVSNTNKYISVQELRSTRKLFRSIKIKVKEKT